MTYLLNTFTTDDKVLLFALHCELILGAQKRLGSIIAAEGSHAELFFD